MLRVVLLFGGRSSEHEISCVTAAGVLRAIDRERFEVIPVGITKDGATVLLTEELVAGFELTAGDLPEVRDNGTRVLWPESTRSRELKVLHGESVRSLGDIDAVLPMLHGPYGEDGTVQGMLELLGVPFVGSGVLGSALCMDKHMAKTVLKAAGIAVAPWRRVTKNEVHRRPEIVDRLDEGLVYPLFVKPARAGSSVGITKIEERSELSSALTVAFAEDSIVLVEEGVAGREIEVAVLGGRHGAAPRSSSVVGEIVSTGREFYDYDAKYLAASGIELELPATVTEEELAQLRETAERAFEATQCAGLARVDFFLTPSGIILNEINTLPGFTPISMYPRLWEASGLSYEQLITELIELGIENH